MPGSRPSRIAMIACCTVAALSLTVAVTGGRNTWTLGLPAVITPADNPTTAAKVALGRRLFFDKLLSADNSISCSTCHDPNAGFADPHPVSVGVKARTGQRNSNTLLNIAFIEPLMWDGKAVTLEDQTMLPFRSTTELDLPPEDAVLKLRRQGYSEEFEKVFGVDVTMANLAKALAAYQRTLLAGSSPFDSFLFAKDTSAIDESARRGFDVFLRSKCDACHLIMAPGFHPFAVDNVMFTDLKFHNLGVDATKPNPDAGRYAITGDESDWGRFRTPTLRNVALTAPYFHDGSAATLFDVVDFYDRGGGANRNLDPSMHPLHLAAQEKRDLVQFLRSLTSSGATELAHEGEKSE